MLWSSTPFPYSSSLLPLCEEKISVFKRMLFKSIYFITTVSVDFFDFIHLFQYPSAAPHFESMYAKPINSSRIASIQQYTPHVHTFTKRLLRFILLLLEDSCHILYSAQTYTNCRPNTYQNSFILSCKQKNSS